MSRWSSSSETDVTWRRRQMSANNDIEGVGRDAAAEKLVARLEAEGVPIEKRRDALRSYFAPNSK
jgi:hypothetical protein